MNFLKTIILSLIHGITEIAPFSSSAHYLILESIFRTSLWDSRLAAARDAGVLFALAVYFAKDLWQMLKEAPIFLRLPFLRGREAILLGYPHALILGLIVITLVPSTIVGFAFQETAGSVQQVPFAMGAILILTGILILQTGNRQSEERMIYEMNHRDSFLIGIAQGFSVLPGIAAIAATVWAGISLGINRKEALRFASLTLIPWLLARLIREWFFPGAVHPVPSFLWGLSFFVSAIGAYLTLCVVIRLIEKTKYHLMGIYCVGLGLFALFFFYLKSSGLS